MIYAFDTPIVSALMRSEEAVTRRLLTTSRESVLLPQPVVSEIVYGIALLPASRRRREVEAALATLLGDIRRASWTDEVSREFGRLKAELDQRGERVDDFDVAIAAHALVLGATVVTRNLRHFTRIRRLEVEDWGEA